MWTASGEEIRVPDASIAEAVCGNAKFMFIVLDNYVRYILAAVTHFER
tara:strand:+ start:4327 stop:4470 length:144 start_codon:yes stop_codon:yes gene_type:complete